VENQAGLVRVLNRQVTALSLSLRLSLSFSLSVYLSLSLCLCLSLSLSLSLAFSPSRSLSLSFFHLRLRHLRLFPFLHLPPSLTHLPTILPLFNRRHIRPAKEVSLSLSLSFSSRSRELCIPSPFTESSTPFGRGIVSGLGKESRYCSPFCRMGLLRRNDESRFKLLAERVYAKRRSNPFNSMTFQSTTPTRSEPLRRRSKVAVSKNEQVEVNGMNFVCPQECQRRRGERRRVSTPTFDADVSISDADVAVLFAARVRCIFTCRSRIILVALLLSRVL